MQIYFYLEKIHMSIYMTVIHFISYGDSKYLEAKKRIEQEAIDMNVFSTINIYSPLNIDESFMSKHMNILSHVKGNGYWLWKEYFILKRLNEIDAGEYLVYCDSGCTINSNGINRFNEYIEMIDKSESGILSFQLCFPEEWYTTSQIFNSLDISNTSSIRTSGQFVGGILIMKKCDNVMNIFNKFFKIINQDQKLITDHYNKINQIKEFIDNRHDQSILSVIRKLYGSVIIPDETWYANFNCNQAKFIPFLATRKR
jgi:hypothetical protein